jgi:arabinogalactan endo-1,4-beta-galactosidase
LLKDIYEHTFEVVDSLNAVGIIPEWVQIGNEITQGILWPEGSTSKWDQLSQLLNKGYEAVKAVNPGIKVILHLDQGNDNLRFRSFFDNAHTYGVNYDVIGASYYPFWLGTDYLLTIDDLEANLKDLVNRYGKEVMVVETGGEDLQVQNTYDMLVSVIKKLQDVTGEKGLGVIYWEPKGARSWSYYPLSCWNSDGKPTTALRAFLYPELAVDERIKPSEPWISPSISGSGQVRFDISGMHGITHFSIFDVSGKTVKVYENQNLTSSLIQIVLLPGVYIVEIRSREKSIRKKFIIW